jgi:hypothetical protein
MKGYEYCILFCALNTKVVMQKMPVNKQAGTI